MLKKSIGTQSPERGNIPLSARAAPRHLTSGAGSLPARGGPRAAWCGCWPRHPPVGIWLVGVFVSALVVVSRDKLQSAGASAPRKPPERPRF
jgi:hypothetical protein